MIRNKKKKDGNAMASGIYDIFAITMENFERAYQVRHVATFDLVTCVPDENVREVFVRYPDFDQIPVVENKSVIGVLEQKDQGEDAPVRSQMRLLSDEVLIAADEPISHVLPLLRRSQSYRLVLEGTRISGLVTRSDVLKLPVRLYAFGMVTHLETLMGQIIDQRLADTWMEHLNDNRRKKVEEKQLYLQQRRTNPPLLELTDFCDKRDIVRSIFGLSKKFKEELASIEELRNQVAHAGNYAADDIQLVAFLERLERARYWIDELHRRSEAV
jgi:predicted transcriptional regulator